MLERRPLQGGIYSAQPIGVERPLWRVDLLESVDSPPGSLDRAHHHPAFDGWEPGARHFVPELSAAPVEWLAGAARPTPTPCWSGPAWPPARSAPATSLRCATRRRRSSTRCAGCWPGWHAGELGRPDDDRELVSARIGWL